MTSDDFSPLAPIFWLLDRWRHFPAYQLERRADIYFAVYLHEVLEGETGVRLHKTIIPELPLKRDLIWPDKPTSKSVKVDYALFAHDLSKVFFVELKTDVGSRRDEQDDYLEKATELGLKAVVEGICDIARATSAHQKYHHLIAALAELGLVTLPDDLADYVYPKPRPGLSDRLRQLHASELNPPIEVRYVQPVGTSAHCIDFETFAQYVDRHDDALSKLFAPHLRAWTSPAGSVPP